MDTALWPSERCSTHLYRGAPKGKRNGEVPHINDCSSPLSVFLLYFAEIITLLVVGTNRYYHAHLDRLDKGPSPQLDVTEAEMLVSCNNNKYGTLHTRQNWQTTVQGLTITTQLSTATVWNGTDSFTSFAIYISQTTRMSPIWRTKILTNYGKWESVWNSKQEIFKILQPFWTSGRRRSYC